MNILIEIIAIETFLGNFKDENIYIYIKRVSWGISCFVFGLVNLEEQTIVEPVHTTHIPFKSNQYVWCVRQDLHKICITRVQECTFFHLPVIIRRKLKNWPHQKACSQKLRGCLLPITIDCSCLKRIKNRKNLRYDSRVFFKNVGVWQVKMFLIQNEDIVDDLLSISGEDQKPYSHANFQPQAVRGGRATWTSEI